MYFVDTTTGHDSRDATAPEPVRPPDRGVWKTLAANVRAGFGVPEAAAQVLATGVELAEGIRQARDSGWKRAETFSIPQSDLADSLRWAGRQFRLDPATATEAEQVIYGLGRGLGKLVPAMMAMGPAGAIAAGLEEANTVASELKDKGVDQATRTQVGLVQGAGMAMGALPVVGQSIKSTMGLYALGGPGGFMAQQAATRAILQHANYSDLAKQYDPTDIAGLMLSSMIPLPFAAWGVRGIVGRSKAAAAIEADLRAGRTPDGKPILPEPKPTAVADAVSSAFPRDVVDAAMVHNLTLQADRAEWRGRAQDPAAYADSVARMEAFSRRNLADMNMPADQLETNIVPLLEYYKVHAAQYGMLPHEFAEANPVYGTDRSIEGFNQPGSPEFQRWFGDSKVVDARGKPLVVYHGTDADITAFDNSKLGTATGAKSAKQGHFFVSDPQVADGYAHHAATDAKVQQLLAEADRLERVAQRTGKDSDWAAYDRAVEAYEAKDQEVSNESLRGQNVVPAYLSLKNPVEFDAGGKSFAEITEQINRVIRQAKASGHDGVILRNLDDAAGRVDMPADHYVVFDPKQIKSATGNRGTYDPNDPSILRQSARDMSAITSVHRAATELAAGAEESTVVGLRPARGTFNPITKTISTLKSADPSTFQHELGHFFIDNTMHLAAQADVPTTIKADAETLLKWGGVTDLDTWHRMTLDDQRALHEKFATAWETYLMRGEAPTPELRGVFERFRDWMIGVYHSLRNAPGDFTPEVRAVMDRMIAGEVDIRRAAETPKSAVADMTTNGVLPTPHPAAPNANPAESFLPPDLVPVAQSVASRLADVEARAPDTPVRLGEDGQHVTVADELARVRREAAEGHDGALGALDADLVQVAANCALSLG